MQKKKKKKKFLYTLFKSHSYVSFLYVNLGLFCITVNQFSFLTGSQEVNVLSVSLI